MPKDHSGKTPAKGCRNASHECSSGQGQLGAHRFGYTDGQSKTRHPNRLSYPKGRIGRSTGARTLGGMHPQDSAPGQPPGALLCLGSLTACCTLRSKALEPGGRYLSTTRNDRRPSGDPWRPGSPPGLEIEPGRPRHPGDSASQTWTCRQCNRSTSGCSRLSPRNGKSIDRAPHRRHTRLRNPDPPRPASASPAAPKIRRSLGQWLVPDARRHGDDLCLLSSS